MQPIFIKTGENANIHLLQDHDDEHGFVRMICDYFYAPSHVTTRVVSDMWPDKAREVAYALLGLADAVGDRTQEVCGGCEWWKRRPSHIDPSLSVAIGVCTKPCMFSTPRSFGDSCGQWQFNPKAETGP